jgi:1,2-phenylacetyl-CoA epoxidase catalytic subunit
MKSKGAFAPGSARVSRADYGVSPQETSLRAAWAALVNEKFAMAGTPSPARETRALPEETHIGNA